MKYIVLIICITTMTGCGGGNKERASLNTETDDTVRVRVCAAEETAYTPYIESFGSIAYSRKIDITPPVGGTVGKIHVKEGEEIKKGDLLAQLNNVQLHIREQQDERALAEAEAAVMLTEAALREGELRIEGELLQQQKHKNFIAAKQLEVERRRTKVNEYEELFALDGISKEKLENEKVSLAKAELELHNLKLDLQTMEIGFRDRDIERSGRGLPASEGERFAIITEINTLTLKAEHQAARSRLYAAEANLKSTRLLLNELNVTAPADGIVGARYVEIGERTTGKETLFTVFIDEQLYAVFPIQEENSTMCGPGQSVEVIIPSLENLQVFASIDLISPTVDPASGNIMIKALIHDPEDEIKPGMFVRTRISGGKERNTIFLPVSAVRNRIQNTGTVFMVTEGKVFPIEITLGEEEAGKVEVIEGITPGMLVVDSPPPLLQEGNNVEITENN